MTKTTGLTSTVALVTRTRTINQGNQALSIAWRDYIGSRYPSARVRLFERIPTFLRRYTVKALAAEPDPIASFDQVAQELLEKAPTNPGLDPSTWGVSLDPAQQQFVRFRRLRQALRLRSRMASLNYGAAEYLSRLRHLTYSDLVVVNPAGEFHSSSTDTALLYLLETRCAQLAGCRTAIVNLSFEVTDHTIIRLSDHVFSSCDIVEFRDEESLARVRSLDWRREPVVLPDGVVLAAVQPSVNPGGRGVALAINSAQISEAGLAREIREFIVGLVDKWRVTLTSNEWGTDRPFWRSYLDITDVDADGFGLGFDDYASFLAGFDVVVSSRLHSCVLGMLAGVPVVPVECGTFKLTGFFNQIGMPNEPIQIGSEAWQQALMGRVAEFHANRDARIGLQNERIAGAARRLRSGLDFVFREDLLDDPVGNKD